MTTRKFIASSELFCDYCLEICLTKANTIEDIINCSKDL